MAFTRIGRTGVGPSSGEDYGLDAVAQHNAVATTEKFPLYQEDAKGLGIYEGYISSDAIRTRSGRSAARHDSPFSVGSKSRVSKSPAARTKKEKKAKSAKSKTPRLTAPLSVLTKDMNTPIKDMDAWVNRPAEVRHQETEERNGYVTRPMNSFMLYRSAYAERTKAWCTQNNHQVVSAVCGESWPMEPQDVRDQFNEWARLERENHQAAHPDYKFSPCKPVNKRRKGEFSDEEDDVSDVGADPDGDYRGPKVACQKRPVPHPGQTYLNNTVGFSSNPYFTQQPTGYDNSQYQYTNPSRPLPSNIAYDHAGIPYDPHTGQYLVQQQSQYQYSPSIGASTNTTNSTNETPRTVGGYGLPGDQQVSVDDMLAGQRCDTPMQALFNQMNQTSAYQQFGQVYHQIAQQEQQQQFQQLFQEQQEQQQSYEHQQYLQSAARLTIDPSLGSDFMKSLQTPVVQSDNQFETAMGEMIGNSYVNMDFFNQPTSPTWSPKTQK
ncbi:Hypothetical protein R9X50_00256800 [Acrodontium crateriforme]|uniref:HMG box domain-containing protein n=1 Tax=Acrodontium crateriforme TaxID=150365 RepID=A0AAQ3M2P7_9PEZI|nr:Hypothetical protein R9X50_00256800 [Acrodontium crateriforme]